MTAGRPRKSVRRKSPLMTWFKNQGPTGLSAEEMGRVLEVSKSTIYAILDGSRIPKIPVAIRIERMTGGAVTLASWIRYKRR